MAKRHLTDGHFVALLKATHGTIDGLTGWCRHFVDKMSVGQIAFDKKTRRRTKYLVFSWINNCFSWLIGFSMIGKECNAYLYLSIIEKLTYLSTNRSLSLCFALSLPCSLYLSPFLYLSIYLHLALTLRFSLSLFLSFSLSLFLSFSLSLFLSFSLSLFLSGTNSISPMLSQALTRIYHLDSYASYPCAWVCVLVWI